MPELHASDFKTGLTRKGFESKESHHTMFFFSVRGRRTSIRTKLSHNQRRVDDSLLNLIAKQLHLSKHDLLRFIECEISEEEYAAKMIQEGYINLR